MAQELCSICSLPAIREGLCSACLRMKAVQDRKFHAGCQCPVGAEATCAGQFCPRRSKDQVRSPKCAEIQRVVCSHYGITLAEMLSARRNAHFVRPRHIAIYLCSKLTPLSLNIIARIFKREDHTTVMHAIKKIEALEDREEVEHLLRILSQTEA